MRFKCTCKTTHSVSFVIIPAACGQVLMCSLEGFLDKMAVVSLSGCWPMVELVS